MYMEDVYEEKIIRELSKKYSKKEKLFYVMLKNVKNNGYTLEQFKKIIDEFYLENNTTNPIDK